MIKQRILTALITGAVIALLTTALVRALVYAAEQLAKPCTVELEEIVE